MPTTSRSGSTSPTTGCRTRSCGPGTTASAIRVGGAAPASRAEVRPLPGDARRGHQPRAGRSSRPRPSSATSRASAGSPRTSWTACRSPSHRRSRSSPRSRASCRPTSWRPSRASSGGSRTRCRRRAAGTRRPATRSSATPTSCCSAPFLDAHLSEPFRERVRERLARGWESAIDQPRYGPNSAVVVRGDRPSADLGPADLSRLAVAAASPPRTGPRLRGRAASRRPTTTRSGSRRRWPSGTRRPRCPIPSRRSCGARSAGRCTASSSATRSSRRSSRASSARGTA